MTMISLAVRCSSTVSARRKRVGMEVRDQVCAEHGHETQCAQFTPCFITHATPPPYLSIDIGVIIISVSVADHVARHRRDHSRHL
jgi:hypothetical protein